MIYVSSHNIISSLGFTTEENLYKIRKGISGIKIVDNKELSPEPAPVSIIKSDDLENEFVKISPQGNYTRFEKLIILSVEKALKQTKITISDPKTLIVLSTTKGSIDLLEEGNKDLFESDRVLLTKSADILQNYFKTDNKPVVISNACISGGLALLYSKRILNNSKYENIVVVGGDIISEFTLSGFQSFKAVGSIACRPFDKDRDGITPGEGAGTIILTKIPEYASNERIIISGGACTNDANHISGPSRTGDELSFAINKAMEEAHKEANSIDYISAHGTATPYNDEMESKAISIAGLENVPLTSIKGYLGHTFGAAGIIESIIGICAISNNEIYKTAGFKEIGISNPVNVTDSYSKKEINSILKTASGFGGCNLALIFEKSQNEDNNIFLNITDSKQYINKSITIRGNRVLINRKENYIQEDFTTFGKFSKSIYKNYNIKYPKYFKMDNLSKLGFLACDILLKDINLTEKYKNDEIGIILSNKGASIDTDIKYQETIKDRNNYFPSPSVFVYTLANVMVGEMCIRNKIKGENTVFISQKYNNDLLFNYVKLLFNSNKIKACVTGHIEFTAKNYEVVFSLVESEEGNLNFNKKNLQLTYNN
jgi:3-oxoacyl-(acyl-carrier-protein) synthase